MKDNHLSYKPTATSAAGIEKLREKFIELDDLIDETFNDCIASDSDGQAGDAARSKALAKTNLEQARMWAVTALIRASNNGPANSQGTVSGQASKAA